MGRCRLLALSLFAATAFAASIGPEKGTLIIAGGGTLGPEIIRRFIDLAGGKDAPMVFIPTAEEIDPPKATAQNNLLTQAGCTHVTILHTRDPKVADSVEFVLPLETARAVWFEGGRQWRLVDSYLNTRTEREIWKVLDRGGVVGGTSAGATIQGSYLVRGAREGNTIMMAPGYETGLGFLKNAAIDQHIITRHRENDLNAVIAAHPELLGIGIDEGTAIVVHGDRFEVIGKSKVFIHDAHASAAGSHPYYTLDAGDWFDLEARRQLAAQ
ncbi:MAG TPA: cyanophycinase [Bryobacteraceae bacterium]|nr:cyanophycinase [Bryobacteraceae bacterium]